MKHVKKMNNESTTNSVQYSETKVKKSETLINPPHEEWNYNYSTTKKVKLKESTTEKSETEINPPREIVTRSELNN